MANLCRKIFIWTTSRLVVGKKRLYHMSDQGSAVGIGSHKGIRRWLITRG
jgi:hypothetical protein